MTPTAFQHDLPPAKAFYAKILSVWPGDVARAEVTGKAEGNAGVPLKLPPKVTAWVREGSLFALTS